MADLNKDELISRRKKMSEERRLVDISPLLGKNVDFAKNTLFANSSEKFMFKCGVKEVLDRLEALPTIDPETLRPVGYWEVGGVDPVSGVVGNWKCSLCNETSPEDSPFCPYCGAKMEDSDA